jgi:hypothetical protein
MRVFLDEQPIQVDQPTLAAALSAGRAAADARSRVIVEVKLDGRPVSGPELDEPSQAPQPGSEVRLLTAEPRALVRTTLLDVADLLPQAREMQGQAARKFQAGQFQEAFADLTEALSVWDTVRQVVEQGPSLLGLSVMDLKLGGESMVTRVEGLSVRLGAVRSALTSQDWSTLADCLEGDLDAAAEDWATLLRALADQISQRPAPGRAGGGA